MSVSVNIVMSHAGGTGLDELAMAQELSDDIEDLRENGWIVTQAFFHSSTITLDLAHATVPSTVPGEVVEPPVANTGDGSIEPGNKVEQVATPATVGKRVRPTRKA